MPYPLGTDVKLVLSKGSPYSNGLRIWKIYVGLFIIDF